MESPTNIGSDEVEQKSPNRMTLLENRIKELEGFVKNFSITGVGISGSGSKWNYDSPEDE